MKTGDILLVSGKSEQARLIQKFQSIEDAESGYCNHSGIVLEAKNGIYVAEASYIQQRKVKAAIVLTPIEHYLNGDYDLLLLEHNYTGIEKQIEQQIFKYAGTPYEYTNLTFQQMILKLTGIWVGRNKHADKRFICHEFTMTVWDNIANIFPECRKGQVKEIFHSNKFKHKEL